MECSVSPVYLQHNRLKILTFNHSPWHPYLNIFFVFNTQWPVNRWQWIPCLIFLLWGRSTMLLHDQTLSSHKDKLKRIIISSYQCKFLAPFYKELTYYKASSLCKPEVLFQHIQEIHFSSPARWCQFYGSSESFQTHWQQLHHTSDRVKNQPTTGLLYYQSFLHSNNPFTSEIPEVGESAQFHRWNSEFLNRALRSCTSVYARSSDRWNSSAAFQQWRSQVSL